MNSDPRGPTDDQFPHGYNATDLRIASEFLSNWLPFLSRDLCHHCTQTLSDRIRSIDIEVDGDEERIKKEENLAVLTPKSVDSNEFSENQNNWDTNSLGSWKDAAEMNDTSNMNSRGSWKDGANGLSEHVTEASTSDSVGSPVVPIESPKVWMSWADMAQEDELEEEEENEVTGESVDGHAQSEPREATVAVKVGQKSESWAYMAQEDELEGEEENELIGESVDGHVQSEPREAAAAVKVGQKPELSRDQREYIRFSSVKRKKDFICLERVKGKIVNILDGLELHTGVFSAAEQKRIVDFVYLLQEKGKKGELKEHTYSAPQKKMRGKGRVTIQFGCCYNYATDKNGNPPGILQNEIVDPIPHLFKVIIRRLVRWHVVPPSCVPDSCIVNIYEEGDCIPPHIDPHDFVRPFCTVSFLSECNILFGSNLKMVGPSDFSGAMAIPLPVGSVLVLNGNGADVVKHCVPAVPKKRISITFRKMDESKVPIGFVPEPDLQGLQPLSYETDRSKRPAQPKPKLFANRQVARREDNRDRGRGSAGRGNNHLDPQVSLKIQLGPSNKRRVKVNLDG